MKENYLNEYRRKTNELVTENLNEQMSHKASSSTQKHQEIEEERRLNEMQREEMNLLERKSRKEDTDKKLLFANELLMQRDGQREAERLSKLLTLENELAMINASRQAQLMEQREKKLEKVKIIRL